MERHRTAKSFQSGNSVAIRLPASLGVRPGSEWAIEEREGDLVLRLKDKPKRKFDVDAIWGIAKGSGMRVFEPEERVFAERPSVDASEHDNDAA